MTPEYQAIAQEIDAKLLSFNEEQVPLPGITDLANRECLVAQIIDSIKRVKYVTTIRDRNVSAMVADATNMAFDPIKAASWHIGQNNLDEAFWLSFLSIHFGKNGRTGWALTQAIYGGFESPAFWNWPRIVQNPESFRDWLRQNEARLRDTGSFGNHRKYQSLKADYQNGTANTLISYVEWVNHEGSHLGMINSIIEDVGNDPKVLFNALYKSMNSVIGFGRTARFDYLTMIGKLGLVNIVPDSTYMQGATGPLDGARLLFTGQTNGVMRRPVLEQNLAQLEEHLDLYFGMQILEDSLCNWQKNPDQFQHFRG